MPTSGVNRSTYEIMRPEEVGQVVRAAVAETNGKVPVIAGCGYGTAIATVLFSIMLVYITFVLWRIYQQEKELA